MVNKKRSRKYIREYILNIYIYCLAINLDNLCNVYISNINFFYLTSKAEARYLNMLSDEFPIN